MEFNNKEYYSVEECIELMTWRESKDPKKNFKNLLSKHIKPINIEGRWYFQKSMVDYYVAFEKESIPVKNFIASTGYKSVDGLCSFIRKCNIEVYNYDSIPFEKYKRIKKEDIKTVMYYLQNKELLKSDKYPKYVGDEEVYNLDECRELFTWVDNEGFNQKDVEFIRFVSRRCRLVNQHRYTYFLKEDIDAVVKEQSRLMPLVEILQKTPYSSVQSLGKYLESKGFEIISPKNIPYYPHRSFLKNDFEDIVNILGELDINLDEYYSTKDALKLFCELKMPISRKTLSNFFEKTEHFKTSYFLKKDIDKFIELGEKTVQLSNVYKILGFNKADSLKRFLIRYGFSYIDKNEHPFGNGVRMFKEDIEAVKRVKTLNEQYISSGRHEKYEVLKKMVEIGKNKSAAKTLQDLDFYIEECINNSESDSTSARLAISGSRIYSFISLNAPTDIMKMSTKTFAPYLSLFENNPNYSIYDLVVFVNFYNHILDKYSLVDKEKYYSIDFNKNDLYNQDSIDTSPYTREQFLELCYVLYNNIFELELFNKVRESKFLANTWLYMALHFIVAWRRQDILEITPPDLRVIGFDTPDDFLNFLTSPCKFTEDMGFAICSNVKLLVEGVGTLTNKTGTELVIEIGRVFSRALGMVLALCEAFRQKNNDTLLISGYATRKKAQEELLGEDFQRIFGKETFNNRRANKAFENYLISKTEEDGTGIGYFIGALARSHNLNKDLIPISTQKYVNREVDKDVSAAAIELWNSGSFGFVKYELLSMIEEDFDDKRLSEKRNEVKKINLSPLSINDIVKTVSSQKEISRKILKSLSQDEETFKETVKNLTKKVAVSKSNYAKCLLRAIPLEKLLDYNGDKNFLIESSIRKPSDRCLYPNVTNCDGCPMLIAQIYYLFELNNKIEKLLDNLESSTCEFDVQLYNQIFNQGYSPILQQISEEIGIKSVNSIIPLGNIKHRLIKLEEENKLILN